MKISIALYVYRHTLNYIYVILDTDIGLTPGTETIFTSEEDG